MGDLSKVSVMVGSINCILILAGTLGALGFLGLPYEIGIGITGFMRKTFHPYYFETRIAHIVSFLAIIGLIVLFVRKEIGVPTLITGIFLNLIWMGYYKLLLMN